MSATAGSTHSSDSTCPTATTERRMLSAREVAYMLGVSLSTLYKMVREGRFPQGVMLTGRLRKWHLETVEEFVRGFRR